MGRGLLATYLPILIVIICPIIFVLPMLGGIELIGLNDWDLFMSYYQPVREALLAHQFPWWNPYNSGGIPLFGNPQVGVISLQTPFIFLFGVVAGLKYAAVLYYVLGSTGMYFLTRRLASPTARAVLLSLVWTFSSFMAFHFYIGHYIFLSYLLVPWLFYWLIRCNDSIWFAPVFGLSLGLFINTALHNTAIQALVFLTAATPFVWWAGGRQLKTLGAYLLALMVALPLALPRVLLSHQFVSQYSRENEAIVQLPIPWQAAWRALTAANQTVSDTSLIQNVGWWEVSAFIGLLTIITAVAGMVISAFNRRYLPLVFCLLALLAFVIALGNNLYQILTQLPVFDLMRVPGRWLAWVIFPIILAIGATRVNQWRQIEVIICLALAITVGQEVAFIRPQFKNIFNTTLPAVTKNKPFEQYEYYPAVEGGYTGMYPAQLAGYGEVWGYEAVLGYNWKAKATARCGVNNGCQLLSPNAELTFWSPNVVKLKRLDQGQITININPSSYLRVNGRWLYPESKVSELLETVVVTDPADSIILEMRPQLFK